MTRVCERCGSENLPQAIFCRMCGRRLDTEGLKSAAVVTPLMRAWRQLVRDLTRKEVRRILGEPLRVSVESPTLVGGEPEIEVWRYEYRTDKENSPTVIGQVSFTADEGRLRTWIEPDWRVYVPPHQA